MVRLFWILVLLLGGILISGFSGNDAPNVTSGDYEEGQDFVGMQWGSKKVELD